MPVELYRFSGGKRRVRYRSALMGVSMFRRSVWVWPRCKRILASPDPGRSTVCARTEVITGLSCTCLTVFPNERCSSVTYYLQTCILWPTAAQEWRTKPVVVRTINMYYLSVWILDSQLPACITWWWDVGEPGLLANLRQPWRG